MKITKRFDGGRLFAGANSAKGFISFYDNILSDKHIKRVYILKGGPGTGKSSFMKRAASQAESLGISVERYNCSSDPDSLDAIVIGESVAILDGTAPHSVDPLVSGAREEIINLGAFWDAEKLAEQYETIRVLGEKKSECYKKAYRYLEAYKNVSDINFSLAFPFMRFNKARRAVERTFAEIKCGGGFEITAGLVCSVGMKGKVRYDTYEHFADKIYLIEDCFGTAHIYLNLLLERARLTDTPVRVSYDPIDTSKPDAIFFLNDRKAFVIGDRDTELIPDRRINMKRFFDASKMGEYRSEYRLNSRLLEALMDSVLESLLAAGKYHFELEKIYVSCMDFEAEEVFCKNFLNNLIKR